MCKTQFEFEFEFECAVIAGPLPPNLNTVQNAAMKWQMANSVKFSTNITAMVHQIQ
jgi:hypothetical protein